MNPFKRLLGLVFRVCEHKEIHAFKVRLDDRIYYVCARCSGLYLGMFSGLLIAILLMVIAPVVYQLGDFTMTLIAIILALPAMLDWTTQRLAWRESRNSIRFWTALPAGYSLSWYIVAPVSLLIKIPVLIGVLVFLAVFGYIDRRPPYEPAQDSLNAHTQPNEITSQL